MLNVPLSVLFFVAARYCACAHAHPAQLLRRGWGTRGSWRYDSMSIVTKNLDDVKIASSFEMRPIPFDNGKTPNARLVWTLLLHGF